MELCDGIMEAEMAELNLKIGEHVHYGAHGVCRVCGQEKKNFGGKEELYFTLRPTGSENILLYLPANAEPEKVRLRRLLSKEQILQLIREAQEHPAHWISDNKVRRETFSKILRGGDTMELIDMLRNIYIHREELPQGKQLPMSDQEMMTAAQRQLHSEMSYVLELDEKQVLPFVLHMVGAEEKKE